MRLRHTRPACYVSLDRGLSTIEPYMTKVYDWSEYRSTWHVLDRLPVSHSGHREESIPIFDVHICVRTGPISDALIVIDRLSRANELIGISNIMDELPVALWTYKGSDVGVNGLPRRS